MLWLAGVASGASVPITNPDFETDPLVDGSISGSAPTGWTVAGSIWGYFDPNADYGYPAGENNVAFFYDPSGPASMFQDTTHTVTSGDVFTLSIDFGNRGVGTPAPLNAFTTFGIYDAGTGLAIATRTVTPGDLGGLGTFQPVELNYAATAGDVGKTIRIQINAGLDGSANDDYVDFDNVVLNVVPEPSSAVLGGLGICSLLLRRRRRSDCA
jgi:hypothetical protein